MEETLETIQARHRKEQRDLQSRITSKKKNATKKTRKGVNDECAALERDLKERQELELDALNGDKDVDEQDGGEEPNGVTTENEGSTNETATDVNHITDRLKDTKVSFDLPSSEPTTQNQDGGGGGKKRNRQKDRLARRAAERELAASAASQEAANMTDHRDIERRALAQTFSAHGLAEHEIAPDGHCLFSAVADQLGQRGIPISSTTSDSMINDEGNGDETRQPPYRLVRKVATSYMEAHADDFAPFLEEPLASYVSKIRDTAEWGGQLELLALASAYRVEIRVVQNGRTETIRPGNSDGVGVGGGDNGKEGDRTIWLAYYRHGYGLGEHYNSLRKKG
ncbi:OTU domain-containing protein 6B [Xylaria bambusicola]|uniref:OTU domain-containing protein 6B n=1 Tax=Xylaria bambusicola TaxID=326684 RepID=UPI002008AD40|nr:OTU domain-containing protein 6B [Xylaria bambusicola]KAI0528207.1 OTU domain-containing protein 6B [Xylaria bambusicola]